MNRALSRILGLASDPGPLELLGLSLPECTAARIESSLERQLERVDQHPESDTPEADEVRLALHTAAAQLLDPAVRALLIHEAPRAESVALFVSGPSPAPPVQSDPSRTYTRPSSRRTPDAHPDRALKRLLVGGGVFVVLGIFALVAVLIALTPSRTRTAPTAPTATAASTATPESPAQSPAQAPGASTAATPASVPPEILPPGRAPFKDPGGVLRQLRAAVERARAEPAGAVKDLESIIPLVADWWPKYDPAQRRAVDDAVVEFLYAAASSPDSATAAVGLISARAALPPGDAPVDPDAVWPAAWGAGILTRLSGERELPTPIAAAVREGLNRAVGIGRTLGSTRFDAGAAAALSLMPTRLIAPAQAADEAAQAAIIESFKRWADAVTAGVPDPLAGETVLMDGLERILVDGPEPDTSAAAFAAAELAAARIRWRAAGPARTRLLAWFNDGRISASDLRVVTGAIAGKSAAEGIEPTMILSIGATTDDRALLRARYAAAWGLAKPEGRGRVLVAWRAAAAPSSIPDAKPAPLDAAIQLAVQTRINQAARTLFLGDADAAESILNALPQTRMLVATAGDPTAAIGPAIILPGPANPASPAPPRSPRSPSRAAPAATTEPPSGAEGEWAAGYLKAEQNIPVRLDRLAALGAYSGQLGHLDAAVLAEAACFAAPSQVRYAAQQQALRFVDDPSLVRAMLDMLPAAPRIFSVTALYQRVARTSLPKQGDAEWELATRRALVERLLQMTAVAGEQSVINASAGIVAEAYVSMSMSAGSLRTTDSDADRAVRAAAALYTLWSADAQRLPAPRSPTPTIDQIQRRRNSRDKTASGPAQAFAARQIAVAELLGYIVAAERPLDASKVAEIMADLARSRREAGHVLPQMLATERAMTLLWILRFSDPALSAGGRGT